VLAGRLMEEGAKERVGDDGGAWGSAKWLGFEGSTSRGLESREGGRPAPAVGLFSWRFPDISAVKATIHFAKETHKPISMNEYTS